MGQQEEFLKVDEALVQSNVRRHFLLLDETKLFIDFCFFHNLWRRYCKADTLAPRCLNADENVVVFWSLCVQINVGEVISNVMN